MEVILEILSGLWGFFKKHWFGCSAFIIIAVLALTLHFKNTALTKAAAQVKADNVLVAKWQASNAVLDADLTTQNQAIAVLQQQTAAYKAAAEAAQKAVAVITQNFNSQSQWLLTHPAPTTCTGAMDYLLNAAVNNKP